MLGDQATDLSATSISSLKKAWRVDLDKWRKRQITEKFVYCWADGVNVKIRLGEDKNLCLLVLVGVNQHGEKKLLAVEAGYKESAENWQFLYNDLLSRGFEPPLAIIGDGALGLWSAVDKTPEFSETKELRCWIHRIANILNHFPKRLQPTVKCKLQDMKNAQRKSDAEICRKEFHDDFQQKYPKASATLDANWEEMVAFFDFPAIHWK